MQKALRARKCFFTLISMLFTRPALRTRSMKPSAPIASLTCPSTERRTIPYDFLRKRLSILVAHGDTHLMVTKGALANVLAVCSAAETEGERIVDIAVVRDRIQQHFEELSSKGFRTLGLAYKNMGSALMSKVDEADMTFLGFLVLFDPPKANIIETIAGLKNLGVALKIITGDNHLVAANVSQQMGLSNTKIFT